MSTEPLPKLTLCELTDPGVPGLESYSPFCLKVHRALRAAGLSYQRRHGAHPGVFRHLNPAAQVPVLLVGDEPVFDSTRIVARISELAARSGGTPLHAGPGPRERAEALLWEELADTSLNGFVVAARWADARNWPLVRDAFFAAMPRALRPILTRPIRSRLVRSLHARDVLRAGDAECWRCFESLLDALDARAPARGWWIGDRLSVADVALFGQLRSLRAEITPWQSERVGERTALCAWMDRVDQATRAPRLALAA